ncbi:MULTISPECIES: glycerophosphodiester phosphodiesterase family protein [Gammaproteobacteria]|uniref:glycerophosphodiester phosphodiesterase n=1 Tax=Gammaproteobacteria TaxID=1236 RepID=UPI0014032DC7|nr:MULTISPECIES: glycerophosphodiester phosphodiesterase family protein [Gammaproteobacteria]
MTTWISHRGYCESTTENTAESFRAALEHGFTHLETDLRCSSDGHIVLCHDPDLGRIARHFVPIHLMSRAELQRVELPNGQRLLFFDEFFEEFSKFDWILDIKPENAAQTITKLHALTSDDSVKNFLEKHARFLCWNAQHEDILAARIPKAKFMARDKACYRAGTAALFGLPGLGSIQRNQTYAVPPVLKGVPILNKGVVSRFHDQGAKVIGYLPETKRQHEQALKAGVDELLTNHAHFKPAFD